LELVQEESRRARLTWIGHSSFLGTLGGRSFLIDPVFSRRIAVMVPRYGAVGLSPGDLPPLSALLITHNHYDHLDAPSVRALPPSVPAVVPRGLGSWFRRWNPRPLIELGWWESTEVEGLEITLVPSRHWSRRYLLDTNRTLWGGFVVRWDEDTVYHAGDTAWFDGFAEIGRRFPGLLAAALPIGGYEPAWFMEKQHLNPEQAGRAFQTLGARRMIPMHWGAFKLTDEPIAEPAGRLLRWWKKEGPAGEASLSVPAIGETVVLGGEETG